MDMNMDNLLGGGAGGAMGQFPLEQWFYEMPVCTRWWTVATVATSLLVQCHIITPFQLFYSYRAVFVKNQVLEMQISPAPRSASSNGHPVNLTIPFQYWRLLTTFIYFGPLSLDLLFHVFFLQRYSRLLEESSGRSPAGFSWLLLYATSILLCLSPLLSIPFLGSALSSSLVYIWSRRNPETRLSFLGLLVFTAPYLPWVLMAFSLVLHGSVPKDEICGVIVGHGARLISLCRVYLFVCLCQ
jgi:Derlin-2/3